MLPACSSSSPPTGFSLAEFAAQLLRTHYRSPLGGFVTEALAIGPDALTAVSVQLQATIRPRLVGLTSLPLRLRVYIEGTDPTCLPDVQLALTALFTDLAVSAGLPLRPLEWWCPRPAPAEAVASRLHIVVLGGLDCRLPGRYTSGARSSVTRTVPLPDPAAVDTVVADVLQVVQAWRLPRRHALVFQLAAPTLTVEDEYSLGLRLRALLADAEHRDSPPAVVLCGEAPGGPGAVQLTITEAPLRTLARLAYDYAHLAIGEFPRRPEARLAPLLADALRVCWQRFARETGTRPPLLPDTVPHDGVLFLTATLPYRATPPGSSGAEPVFLGLYDKLLRDSALAFYIFYAFYNCTRHYGHPVTQFTGFYDGTPDAALLSLLFTSQPDAVTAYSPAFQAAQVQLLRRVLWATRPRAVVLLDPQARALFGLPDEVTERGVLPVAGPLSDLVFGPHPQLAGVAALEGLHGPGGPVVPILYAPALVAQPPFDSHSVQDVLELIRLTGRSFGPRPTGAEQQVYRPGF